MPRPELMDLSVPVRSNPVTVIWAAVLPAAFGTIRAASSSLSFPNAALPTAQ